MRTMDDEQAAASAVALYAELDSHSLELSPVKFKRAIAYLCYVTLVFYLVASIYAVKVLPSIVNAFRDLEVPSGGLIALYSEHWGLIIIAITLMLIGCALIALQLSKAIALCPNLDHALALRYFAPRSVLRSYRRLRAAIEHPIHRAAPAVETSDTHLTAYLNRLEATGAPLAPEINAMIGVQAQALSSACERYLRVLIAVVAVVIILGIFGFLVSAYSPIFALGDIV